MHRSERTVHEQILYRLGSTSRPITYHDIRGDGIVTRPAQEVRQDILAAMAALKSLGIGPGDRVAIAGTNSTRYLTLDVAIGMVGAVSVPLYYTSPG
jgi:long-chain acyl-CoA synthetase